MAKVKQLPQGMRYLNSGSIQYRYTYNGIGISVTGSTQKECIDRAKEKESKIDSGSFKKDLTLNEYFDRWYAAKVGTVKGATLRANDLMFKKIANTAIDENGTKLGTVKLSKIERDMVLYVRTQLNKKASTRTTNDSISLLRSILSSAVLAGHITKNPAAGIKALKRTEVKARDSIHRALSVTETKLFFEKAKQLHSWYLPLYTFLINTGCRIGEAGALTAADIDKNFVHIQRTITKTETGSYKIGDDTKTASGTRNVPLLPAAKQAFDQQQQINAMFYGVIEISKPVFRSPNGLLLNDSPVNEDIERICKAAGIEKFTAHAFRDTFATRCVESGMQPKTLQEILGHSNIGMTMNLYAHVMDETKENQMQAVQIMAM